VISSPVDRPWAAEIKRRFIEFMRCLELDDGFEVEVLDTVGRARELLGLPVHRMEPGAPSTES